MNEMHSPSPTTDEEATLLMCALLTKGAHQGITESFDSPGGISSVRHLDDKVRKAYRDLVRAPRETKTARFRL